MSKVTLDPLAEIMISAYLATWSYRKEFLEQHETPPSKFATLHHWRSVIQASIASHERYTLETDYAEFGRVQVKHIDGQRYLLRSDASVAIERAKNQGQLFD